MKTWKIKGTIFACTWVVCATAIAGCGLMTLSSNPRGSVNAASARAQVANQIANQLGTHANVSASSNNLILTHWDQSGGLSLNSYHLSNDAFRLKTIRAIGGGNSFQIEGQICAVGATGTVVLKGADGRTVAQPSSPVGLVPIHGSAAAPQWGDFRVNLSYPTSFKGQTGVLEFYITSPKDGSIQHLLSVHIAFP